MKTPKFKSPLYEAIKDKNGMLFRIRESVTVRTPRGQLLPGCPVVDIWWGREKGNNRNDELLYIRQEGSDDRADVVALTLEQVYATIEALNNAVESA